MTATEQGSELTIRSSSADVLLSGEQSGEGPTIVLLHGLTATRRYVVMGSRVLERSGHRVIAYDARGHGRSSPAADGDYTYGALAGDLELVLDQAGLERAVLAGASMGAHTAVRFALAHPERVQALGIITPAFNPDRPAEVEELAGWDRLARGLREGGVEGFVAAYDLSEVPEGWRERIETVLRQRLGAHQHPEAVADALEAVPRSRPFESMDELGALEVPTVVVASRDEPDPGHPLEVGERYAAAIPGARLIVEEQTSPPRSPIAWQGGQLSKILGELTTQVDT
jgi:pimeloyl-ACP methyl ester carboxylesterase